MRVPLRDEAVSSGTAIRDFGAYNRSMKKSRRAIRDIRMLLVFLLAITQVALSQSGSPTVVISQIYGGGGNQGATLRNDFIELFNRGSSPADVTGWTVQYASASGANWDRTSLSGILQPGQYYLVQAVAGQGGTVSLPTPDAAGGLALSLSSGKVALVRSQTALSGASPTGGNLVDLVGYGDANHSEGRPAPELTNLTAAIRRSGGCTDTDNNSADFVALAPTPRNSTSPVNPCSPIAPIPTFSISGVVNAASYAGGSVAPGQIVVIFGGNLGPVALKTLELNPAGSHVTTSLGGTRVLFDDVPAPVIYTSSGQLSVVVPYAVAGRASTQVRVEYEGRRSEPAVIPVAAVGPGIFTADASGRGQAAVLNQNLSVNGETIRAKKGEAIIIYATGGGQTAPAGEDGKVIGADLPRLLGDVIVKIGGIEVPVLYSGMAPSLVSGALQVNALIPSGFSLGGALPLEIAIGSSRSQAGVFVYLEGGSTSNAGTGTAAEERLAELRNQRVPARLTEIPNDRALVPEDWLAVVSWNIQVGGTSTDPSATRPNLVAGALRSLFGGTHQLLAAQEISAVSNSEILRGLLPGGSASWRSSFIDSEDSMDNGTWFRLAAFVRDSFALFTSPTPTPGLVSRDAGKSLHPPHVARIEVGDFDFTLISLHLTFDDGNSRESARELANILDYLDSYFNDPEHDPDVILCGDFNLPSRLSNQTGRDGIILDAVLDADPRFHDGERRFAVTVHEPTSRAPVASGGEPRNNYDHCLISADALEEFVQARRVDPAIVTDHPEDPESQLTSDHFPIVAFFRTRGPGIHLDLRSRIRPAVTPGQGRVEPE